MAGGHPRCRPIEPRAQRGIDRIGRLPLPQCAGGIAEKNPLLMQIYADVTGCSMLVAGSSQACALGAAVASSRLPRPSLAG